MAYSFYLIFRKKEKKRKYISNINLVVLGKANQVKMINVFLNPLLF